MDCITLPGLVWTCIKDARKDQRHPIFSTILSSADIVEEHLESAGLKLAPGLQEVLEDSTPPTLSFFKSLPVEFKKKWGVYLLVLEKKHSKPQIYIGTGTSTYHGVYARIRDYDTGKVVPRRVTEAVKKGYRITHKGLLCWSPIPPADLVPRVVLVALEATLTFVFWALHGNTARYEAMAHIRLWDLNTLGYGGLCSHSALSELPPGNHELLAEELKAEAIEIARLRRPRLNANSRRSIEKAKKEDPEKYKARVNASSKKKRENNPAREKANVKRCIAKNVEERRHYCDICKHAFTKKAKLREHLTGPKHAANEAAARGKKSNDPAEVSKEKLRAYERELYQKLLEEKRHYCSVCHVACASKSKLTKHLTGRSHIAKASLLEKAALLEAASPN